MSLLMHFVFAVGLLLVISACTQPIDSPPPPIRGVATIEPAPSDSSQLPPFSPAQPEPMPASEWQVIAPGIETRTVTPPQSALAQMIVVRLDPAQVRFEAHYQPGNPLLIAQWRDALPNASVIINANFFTPEYLITGMLVANGQSYGRSFTDRGGMFSIQNGQPVIQSLIPQPYDGRPLEHAVQAFPMLVYEGNAAYQRASDTRGSRRTVIGMDSTGRVLLMVTPGIGLGLYDLSQYLASVDLDLVSAFNLDGGGSTMMALRDTSYTLNSLDAVPAVLAVYPR